MSLLDFTVNANDSVRKLTVDGYVANFLSNPRDAFKGSINMRRTANITYIRVLIFPPLDMATSRRINKRAGFESILKQLRLLCTLTTFESCLDFMSPCC